jgi:hypothetical protein
VKFRGPLDLTEVQGGYSVSVEEVQSSGGAELSIPSHRDRQIYTWHHISGVRKIEVPNSCNEYCNIAIRDIPTRPGPFTVEDMCQ